MGKIDVSGSIKDNYDIITNVKDNIEFAENYYTKEWVEAYKRLDNGKKRDLFEYMLKAQSTYIRETMRALINPIKILGLGTFHFKEARKDYYDIKENSPDLSNDEVVSKVKENYRLRKNKEEILKKIRKTNTINFTIKK